MQALDQVATTILAGEDLSGCDVDLEFPAVLGSDFGHTFGWPNIDSINIVPGLYVRFGSRLCNCEQLTPGNAWGSFRATNGRWLYPSQLFLKLEQQSRGDNESQRNQRNNGAPAVKFSSPAI